MDNLDLGGVRSAEDRYNEILRQAQAEGEKTVVLVFGAYLAGMDRARELYQEVADGLGKKREV
jgi:hypothetical protein